MSFLRSLLSRIAGCFKPAVVSRPPSCACAYCRNTDDQLQEVPGPLGTGGVFVCRKCARSCIALSR